MTSKKRRVFLITGTHGAGKQTMVDYLVKKGFKHCWARRMLLAELVKRNGDTDRPAMNRLATEWTTKNGPEFIVYRLYIDALGEVGNVVIESIYRVAEIWTVRAAARDRGEEVTVLSIDADQRLRYDRIQASRQSETDNITFEQFQEQERVEMANTDPRKHNLVACRELADHKFRNDGTKEDLYREMDRVLQLG